MDQNLFFEVGRVKDAHGLKGELFVRLFAGRADWLDRFTVGYLVSPDESEVQQFEVEEASPHKDGLILKMGLTDRTPAEKLK
ncbi:MAG: ribosome maturation factor RimM, partial [Bdellovibrionota bacterium]